MQQVHLYQRETFRYSAGWSHLDSWQFLCTVRMTPWKRTRDGNDFEDLGAWTAHVRVPQGLAWKQVAAALTHTLQHHRCQHEYDCCGCVSNRVRVRLIRPGHLLVWQRAQRNY